MPDLFRRALRRFGLRKNRVEAARLYAERHWLARRGRPGATLPGRILCYHSVGQPHLGVNDVSPARFRRQLELALELGYRFVSPREIAAGRATERDLGVSFDDAYTSVEQTAHPVLRALGIPYAVFVVSSWADGQHPLPASVMSWRALEKLAGEGVHVGSHSKTHPDFSRLSAPHMAEELEESRAAIEARLGGSVTEFAIPYGQSANWNEAAAAAASRAGYDVLYAQAVNTRPRGTIARSFVTRADDDRIFAALLRGAFDDWEEWIWH